MKLFIIAVLVTAFNAYGSPELLEAVGDNSELRTFIRLIDAGTGIDINFQDDKGRTAVIEAAYSGHNDSLQALIDAGADVNIQDKKGKTALMWAAYYGYSSIARALVNAGADVNIQDERGDTALMDAAYYGYPSIARDLVDARADLNIQNNRGRTALINAVQGYDDQTSYGSRRFNTEGRYKDATDIVQTLIAANASLDIQDADGNTALKLATTFQYFDIAQALADDSTAKEST